MRFCDFIAAEPDGDDLTFAVTPGHYGELEGASGGYVAAVCCAAARRCAPERRPVALDFRFVRSLRSGRSRARTRVLRGGRTLTLVDVEVDDSNGVLGAAATVSLVNPEVLHPLDDEAMVRPGASVTYAEASPFELRRTDAPILGALAPRMKLTDPNLFSTVFRVPWDASEAGAEAACLAADLSVRPPLDQELADAGREWVPHRNPGLSLRFAADRAGEEVVGVSRLERVAGGIAPVRIEVFNRMELTAVGCSLSLLLGVGAGVPAGHHRP